MDGYRESSYGNHLGELMKGAKNFIHLNDQKRKLWLENFLARENDMVEMLQIPYIGEKEKEYLSKTLLKYSKELLELIHKDLVKIHPRSENVVMDIIYYFANNMELGVKREFWLSGIENQNKVLIEVAKANSNPKIQGKACELLVGNCDILITGLKNDSEDKPLEFVMKRLQKARETKFHAEKIKNTQRNREEGGREPLMSRKTNRERKNLFEMR